MKSLVPKFIEDRFSSAEFWGNFKAATLFLDISGFTPMTEKLMHHGKVGAEALSQILNNVFHPLISLIHAHKGFISTFAGDAFTAIFPASDEITVCSVSLRIRTFFEEHRIFNTQFGDFELRVKQGLSFGDVDWGIVGSKNHKVFFFKGEAIDGCAFSEHQCDKDEIILDAKIKAVLPSEDYSLKLKGKEYFLLEAGKEIKFNLKPKEMSEDNFSKIDALFYPKLVQEDIAAEFRDLASVFISFKGFNSFEELNEMVARVIELLESFGGYLSSLDFGDKGSVTLILFGAPTSFEDNSLRAAGFSMAMKSEFGDQVRLGVDFGTTYSGYVGSSERKTYTALGNVVNLSSRFMTDAAFGQVLISKEVSDAVSREFKTEYLGARKFKGKNEKIDTYDLLEPIHFEDEGLHTGDFVGRKEELSALHEFCEPFSQNKFAGFIYVYGPPGIGKSRLLFEFTNKLIADGAQIVVLQTDGVLKKSLNPFITYFLEYFDFSPNDSQKEKYAKLNKALDDLLTCEKLHKDAAIIQNAMDNLSVKRSTLEFMVGLIPKDSAYQKLDVKSRFASSLSIIKSFFLLLSYTQPLILVAEDSIDIDDDSKQALDALSTDIENVPLVIFASCRLNDDGSKPKFLKVNKTLEKEITLFPITPIESKRLVESLFGKKINQELADFIIEKTENNPLYIEEFCKYLLKNNLLKEEEGTYALVSKDTELPEGINSILVSRIDRLSRHLKKTVLTASVLGKEFDITVLKKLLENEPFDVDELLMEGMEQRIWEKFADNTFLFSQSLLQAAAYSMQLTEELKLMHQRVAEAFTQCYPDNSAYFPTIAHHYDMARLKDKAVEFFELAAGEAHEHYRSQEAITSYTRLLEILEASEKKAKTYGRLAEIKDHTGDWKGATELLVKGIKLAEDIQHELEVASLKAYLGEILQRRGNIDKSIEIIKKSLEIAKKHSDEFILSKAYLNLGRSHWSRGEFEKALKELQEAYRLKKSLQENQGMALALYYMGAVFRDQGNYEAALEKYTQSEKVFENVHNKRYSTYPAYDRGILFYIRGKVKEGRKQFDKCHKTYKEISYPSGEAAVLRHLAMISLLEGESEKAMSLAQSSLKIAIELDEKLSSALGFTRIGIIFYETQKYKEAVENFGAGLSIMHDIRAQGYFGHILSYLVCLYVKQGKPSHAIKAAYYHVQNIQNVGTDLEKGRTYLGVAMALALDPKLTEDAKNKMRLDRIAQHIKIDKNTPENYFEVAIAISRDCQYIMTLKPALKAYGEYLSRQGEKEKAETYLKEAKQVL